MPATGIAYQRTFTSLRHRPTARMTTSGYIATR